MILVCYSLLLIVIISSQGVLMDKEAAKYVGCAHQVLQGDFHDLFGNYLKYSAYVLFLLPFVALGIPAGAVLVQIVLMVLAALALRKLAIRLAEKLPCGDLAMALFLLCPFIQSWTLALYTEAFFTCVSILFLERITRSRKPDAFVLLLGVITVLARPVGLIFVGPALLWKVTKGNQWLFWSGCMVLLVLALSIPGIRPAQLGPIVSGQVLAGVPDDVLPDPTFVGTSILDAQLFLLKNLSFVEWLALIGRRMTSFFTLTRTHFSTFHNLVNGTFYLLYPLAILGIWKHRRNSLLPLFFAILLMNALLIGLTHDEWSGRFMVPILPLVIVLASAVVVKGTSLDGTRVTTVV